MFAAFLEECITTDLYPAPIADNAYMLSMQHHAHVSKPTITIVSPYVLHRVALDPVIAQHMACLAYKLSRRLHMESVENTHF